MAVVNLADTTYGFFKKSKQKKVSLRSVALKGG